MHPTHQRQPIQVAILTVSDTRTKADDHAGQRIQSLLQELHFEVIDYQLTKDEPLDIAHYVKIGAAIQQLIPLSLRVEQDLHQETKPMTPFCLCLKRNDGVW